MNWILSFAISLIVLISAIIFAFFVAAGKYKRGRVLTPFNIVFGGVFIFVFICLLPIYDSILVNTTSSMLKAITVSIHNTFQFFTIDAYKNIILESITAPQAWLFAVYSSYLSVAFVVAPILTFGFLRSFFKKASAFVSYVLHYFRDVYVFPNSTKNHFLSGRISEIIIKVPLSYTRTFLRTTMKCHTDWLNVQESCEQFVSRQLH